MKICHINLARNTSRERRSRLAGKGTTRPRRQRTARGRDESAAVQDEKRSAKASQGGRSSGTHPPRSSASVREVARPRRYRDARSIRRIRRLLIFLPGCTAPPASMKDLPGRRRGEERVEPPRQSGAETRPPTSEAHFTAGVTASPSAPRVFAAHSAESTRFTCPPCPRPTDARSFASRIAFSTARRANSRSARVARRRAHRRPARPVGEAALLKNEQRLAVPS